MQIMRVTRKPYAAMMYLERLDPERNRTRQCLMTSHGSFTRDCFIVGHVVCHVRRPPKRQGSASTRLIEPWRPDLFVSLNQRELARLEAKLSHAAEQRLYKYSNPFDITSTILTSIGNIFSSKLTLPIETSIFGLGTSKTSFRFYTFA